MGGGIDGGLLAIFGLVFGALPIVVGLIVAQYPAGALLWVGLAVGYVGMAAAIFDPSLGPGVFVGAVLARPKLVRARRPSAMV